MSVAELKDVIVSNGPGETVSCLKWSPVSNFLSATGWSKEVRIWEVASSTGQAIPRLVFPESAPVLCCDWNHGGDTIIYGSCDGKVRMVDCEKQAIGELGAHVAPVKRLVWNKTINASVSGSWDKTVSFFDPRAAGKPTLQLKIADRVHAMDNRHEYLAVGAADRTVVLYDLRHTKAPLREYAPFLERQSTDLLIFPEKNAFALCSIEGRVRIQYLDKEEPRSFTFRSHKVGAYDAYAVNSMAATDAHDVLATAGSDGSYAFWDKEKKERLKQSERTSHPITASAFNRDGTIFAYATGYDWSKGVHQYHRNNQTQIFLHNLDPSDFSPPSS